MGRLRTAIWAVRDGRWRRLGRSARYLWPGMAQAAEHRHKRLKPFTAQRWYSRSIPYLSMGKLENWPASRPARWKNRAWGRRGIDQTLAAAAYDTEQPAMRQAQNRIRRTPPGVIHTRTGTKARDGAISKQKAGLVTATPLWCRIAQSGSKAEAASYASIPLPEGPI